MGQEPLGVCGWGGGREVGVKSWQVLREGESEPCKVYNVLLETNTELYFKSLSLKLILHACKAVYYLRKHDNFSIHFKPFILGHL